MQLLSTRFKTCGFRKERPSSIPCNIIGFNQQYLTLLSVTLPSNFKQNDLKKTVWAADSMETVEQRKYLLGKETSMCQTNNNDSWASTDPWIISHLLKYTEKLPSE